MNRARRKPNYLSAVANRREDFESAEKWLRKSLHISEKQGDEFGAAESFHQLGLLRTGEETSMQPTIGIGSRWKSMREMVMNMARRKRITI
jgi:hypothetical protein